MDIIYFLSSIYKRSLLFISWNRAEKQAKVLKKVCKELGVEIRNLEIFWMNNKSIIEFGFRMI